ncbi:hypothetical protein ACO0LG_25960 [Undibacterium sp. Ji42W]|uniref:hypothetical protein n=1 Tax=Undibacterium sp. Ji42W TaxID=3413039 RepID=UPI003BF3CDD8
MLPKIQSEAQVLKKILASEYDCQISHDTALNIAARMKNIDEYRLAKNLLEKISQQIFCNDVAHVTNSAGEVAGEDEICCLIRYILNLRFKPKTVFSIEARAYYSTLQNKNPPRCTVLKASSFDQVDIWNPDEPYLCKAYGLPLNRFNVFDEVFIADVNRLKEPDKKILKHYLESGFKTGVIAAGTDFHFGSLIQDKTKFSTMHHLAIGQSYRSKPNQVVDAISALRFNTPEAPILCWLSMTSRHGDNVQAFSHIKTSDYQIPVDDVGFVNSQYDRNFYLPIIKILRDMQVPMILVPHMTSFDMFTKFDSAMTVGMIRRRHLIINSLLHQLDNLGYIG